VGLLAMAAAQQPAAKSHLLVAARSYQSPTRHSSTASDSSSGFVVPTIGSVRPATGSVGDCCSSLTLIF